MVSIFDRTFESGHDKVILIQLRGPLHGIYQSQLLRFYESVVVFAGNGARRIRQQYGGISDPQAAGLKFNGE